MGARLLTRALADEVERHLRSGAFIDEVAKALGIHRQRIYDWVRRGEEVAKRMEELGDDAVDEVDPMELIYVSFAEKVTRARGESTVLAHGVIRSAMTRDDVPWSVKLNAAQKYLEWTNPGRYGHWTRRMDQVPTPEQVEGLPEAGEEADVDEVLEWLESEVPRIRAEKANQGGTES